MRNLETTPDFAPFEFKGRTLHPKNIDVCHHWWLVTCENSIWINSHHRHVWKQRGWKMWKVWRHWDLLGHIAGYRVPFCCSCFIFLAQFKVVESEWNPFLTFLCGKHLAAKRCSPPPPKTNMAMENPTFTHLKLHVKNPSSKCWPHTGKPSDAPAKKCPIDMLVFGNV